MNCEQFQKEIFDSQTKESKAHLEACSSCFELFNQVKWEANLLSTARSPEPPPHLWDQIQNRMERSTTIPRFRIVSWIGIAAALLLGVMGYLVRQRPATMKNEKNLQLNIVEVSPETSRSLVGFVPGYDQEDSKQALANAMIPLPYRRDR